MTAQKEALDSPGDMRAALTGTLSNALGLATAQAIMGVAFIVLARRLQPADFGAFAAMYGAALVAGGLLDFGSTQRMTRDLARGAHREDFSGWLLKRSAIQAPFAIVLALGAIAVTSTRLSAAATVCLAMQALTYPIALGASAPVRALRSPAMAAWFAAFGNVAVLGATLIAPSQQLVGTVAAAAVGSWLVTAALNIASSKALFAHRPLTAPLNPWAGSAPFGVASISHTSPGLYVPLIAVAAGPVEAGLAAAVQKWIQPVTLLPNAFATQMFPTFAAASSNHSAARSFRSLRVIGATGIVAVAILFAFAPQLTETLLGSDYAAAVPVLRMYAITIVPVIFSQPLGAFLQARGEEQVVAVTSLVLAVLSLGAVFALAEPLGAIAAPLVATVSGTVLLLVLASRFRTLWTADAGATPDVG